MQPRSVSLLAAVMLFALAYHAAESSNTIFVIVFSLLGILAFLGAFEPSEV